MIILDTDVLTIVQRAGGSEYENLAERLDSADDEVAVNAYTKLRELLEDFIIRPVLDFDQASASEFGRLLESRIRIGTMDLKIAAITMAHKALLVSRNLTDFRKVPGLRVEDWTS